MARDISIALDVLKVRIKLHVVAHRQGQFPPFPIFDNAFDGKTHCTRVFLKGGSAYVFDTGSLRDG